MLYAFRVVDSTVKSNQAQSSKNMLHAQIAGEDAGYQQAYSGMMAAQEATARAQSALNQSQAHLAQAQAALNTALDNGSPAEAVIQAAQAYRAALTAYDQAQALAQQSQKDLQQMEGRYNQAEQRVNSLVEGAYRRAVREKSARNEATLDADVTKDYNQDEGRTESEEIASPKIFTEEEVENYAFSAIQGPDNADAVMLGRYERNSENSYEQKAEYYGDQYYYLKEWDELIRTYGKEQMWRINEKFLDIQTSSGRDIFLFHDPKGNYPPGCGFIDELNYLEENGYGFVQEGELWRAVR